MFCFVVLRGKSRSVLKLALENQVFLFFGFFMGEIKVCFEFVFG